MSVRPVTQWSRTDFQLNLKLSVARFKLKRTKLFEGLREQRKAIEADLREGQDRSACAKTITLIRDEYMIEVLNILEIYCETLSARQSIIDGSQTCPADLQVQACSILFAAQHVNMPELTNVKKLLYFKFGRPLVCHCADLHCIHPQMKEYLSTAKPPAKVINYHLTMIGKKIGVEVNLLPEEEKPIPLSLRQGNMSGSSSEVKPVDVPVPIVTKRLTTVTSPPLSETYRPTVLSAPPKSDLLRFEDTPESQELRSRFSSLLFSDEEDPKPQYSEVEETSNEMSFSLDSSQASSRGSLSAASRAYDDDTKSIHADIRGDTRTRGDHDTVILCLGSGTLRAGFADELKPSLCLPMVVGFPLGEKVLMESTSLDMSNMYLADDAIRKRGILELIYPIQTGRVHNWSLLPPLWQHVFSKLGITPAEHPVILCVPEYLSQADADQLQEGLRNDLNCPSVELYRDPVVIASGCKISSALIVDCGMSAARVAPVIDGCLLSEACSRFIYGGSQMDFYFSRLLQERNIRLTSSSELHILKEMKEKLAFVALDYNAQLSLKEEEVQYALPDEQRIMVGQERFKAAEPFFQPTLLGVEERGLHHLILRTLMKCPPTSRQMLLQNIILVGGASYLPRFSDRLGAELAALVPRGAVIKLHVLPNRMNLAWLGAKSLK